MDSALRPAAGAVGMSVALSVAGGGMLLQKCAPAPPPPPPVGEVLPINGEVVALVNVYRAQAGLPPLAENGQLDQAANDHSTDMAQRLKMTHSGWNGSTAGQRMVENGYAPRCGENVAYGQRSSTEVMTAWMNSAATAPTSSTLRSPRSASARSPPATARSTGRWISPAAEQGAH